MGGEARELRELMCRVERLEKKNRWLKRAGLTVVVLVGSVVALGAAYAKPAVPQKIVAHEFDVVDSSGRVRMRLNRFSLNFLNEAGRPGIVLINTMNGAGLEFYGKRNQKIGKFSIPVSRMHLDSWGLQFAHKNGTMAISLGGINPAKTDSPNAELQLNGKSPSISLHDAQGFTLDLGSTGKINSRTGVTERTSAASIVMFGNDKQHHEIWQAPQ